jgi:hypothetical protein
MLDQETLKANFHMISASIKKPVGFFDAETDESVEEYEMRLEKKGLNPTTQVRTYAANDDLSALFENLETDELFDIITRARNKIGWGPESCMTMKTQDKLQDPPRLMFCRPGYYGNRIFLQFTPQALVDGTPPTTWAIDLSEANGNEGAVSELAKKPGMAFMDGSGELKLDDVEQALWDVYKKIEENQFYKSDVDTMQQLKRRVMEYLRQWKQMDANVEAAEEEVRGLDYSTSKQKLETKKQEREALRVKIQQDLPEILKSHDEVINKHFKKTQEVEISAATPVVYTRDEMQSWVVHGSFEFSQSAAACAMSTTGTSLLAQTVARLCGVRLADVGFSIRFSEADESSATAEFSVRTSGQAAATEAKDALDKLPAAFKDTISQDVPPAEQEQFKGLALQNMRTYVQAPVGQRFSALIDNVAFGQYNSMTRIKNRAGWSAVGMSNTIPVRSEVSSDRYKNFKAEVFQPGYQSFSVQILPASCEICECFQPICGSCCDCLNKHPAMVETDHPEVYDQGVREEYEGADIMLEYGDSRERNVKYVFMREEWVSVAECLAANFAAPAELTNVTLVNFESREEGTIPENGKEITSLAKQVPAGRALHLKAISPPWAPEFQTEPGLTNAEKIVLAWNPPRCDGGSRVDGYEVEIITKEADRPEYEGPTDAFVFKMAPPKDTAPGDETLTSAQIMQLKRHRLLGDVLKDDTYHEGIQSGLSGPIHKPKAVDPRQTKWPEKTAANSIPTSLNVSDTPYEPIMLPGMAS